MERDDKLPSRPGWILHPHLLELSPHELRTLGEESKWVLVFVRGNGRHGRIQCTTVGTDGPPRAIRSTSAPISLHRPSEYATYRADSLLEIGVLTLPGDYINTVSVEAYAVRHPINASVVLSPHRLLARRLNEYLDRAMDPVDPPSDVEMNARAVLVATKLIRDFSETRHGPSRQDGGLPAWRVRQVTAYVENHLARTPSLDELSALVGLSKFHFCRAFKISTGVSPIRWIQSKRMQIAQDLIVGTTEPLIDVAARLGYRSTAHFSRVFKEHHGVRPTVLRRGD